ncbi:hypothetical protein [Ornithinimicrobium pekingense]|uniref:Zinc-finger domain-containing protein n=1 Tax=Ornithinimicrobium pekingense TaxID=384677 RepID=A0ABQ2F7A2_9MICO|nr:hypothetical protein [Ornithinimicrobium pekingense]GGK59199.1 hypothetical protein GCM10011509_04430 [Ornithinimicrobium pekingense]
MSERPPARTGPCPDEDELVELALGQAERQTSERLSTHLSTCAACRRSYDDLAGAVELVLPAVPRVAPPPAFETATLERIARARHGAPRPDTSAGGSAVPPGAGPSRRAVLRAAAAAVLGVAAGAGATAYLGRDEPDPASPWATPLLTADGQTVGTVSPSYGDQGTLLVIDVTSGPVGRTYTCRLRHADGTTEDVGVWSLAEDRPNSWVVAVPDPGTLAAVELVGPSGSVWSTAVL